MKNFTNVQLFADYANADHEKFTEIALSFVRKKLINLQKIFLCAYSSANSEVYSMSPNSVRPQSRPIRVAECIAKSLAEYYPGNFKIGKYKKYMLYFPEFAQFCILKAKNGKLPPRETKIAQKQRDQKELEFKDCPLLYITHEEKYGKVSISLMLYNAGECVWSMPLSAILEDVKPIEEIEVIVKPKAHKKRKGQA